MGRDSLELIELPRFDTASGSLCFMQEGDHIPFEIDHVSWTEKPRTQLRSSDAGIVALSGSFEVDFGKGGDSPPVRLVRPDRLLKVADSAGWSIQNPSEDCIALELASGAPDPSWPATVVPDVTLAIAATASTI